jgi:dethiobiotin synthetase
MAAGLFITGTDTGVGKTAVTAGLAMWLTSLGIPVGVMKPIQTGCIHRRGRLIPLDSLFLMSTAGVRDDLDLVTPYRFGPPVAPLVASELSGRPIRMSRIMEAYQKLSADHPVMLVEGIGGLLVPITEKATVLDLVLMLNLPVLVVATTALGTINHTRLTVRCAQQAGIRVAGVVLNHPKGRTMTTAERTASKTVSRLIDVPLIGVLPHVAGLDVEAGKPGKLRLCFEKLGPGLRILRQELAV